MRKIPTLFQRNYDTDRLVRNEVVPGGEWVLAGEGIATRKYDGTCCLIQDGKLFKRHELKPGKPAPVDFIPANEIDDTTGKQQGWVPVGDGPEDVYHREGWRNTPPEHRGDGTAELLGPKIQGNMENAVRHFLLRHEHAAQLTDAPRDFEGIRDFLQQPHHFLIPLEPATAAPEAVYAGTPEFDAMRGFLLRQHIEGIVWHHPDGRMVKIKQRDFGMKRTKL